MRKENSQDEIEKDEEIEVAVVENKKDKLDIKFTSNNLNYMFK